ncbi:hypothetical protein ACFO28_07750 [Flavobacterium buctense]|uniref:hypothetical protein n=1 Tax=Flavobacterium buctense TaxID=1648146 RepID=UPI003620F5C8
MKNFKTFVDHIVTKWRVEKKTILESYGLGVPSNREVGDMAEKYILSKIDKLVPTYISCMSKGSQTPSDIYSVARRNGYWHIMLTQVKSSSSKNAIYELNKNDIEEFSALAKFIKAEIRLSGLLDLYKTKPIIISIGYAGVHSSVVNGKTRHRTIKVKPYKLFKMNFSESEISQIQIRKTVNISHSLGLKKNN